MKKGFTLLEMVVTVIIISLLVIVFFSLFDSTKRSKINTLANTFKDTNSRVLKHFINDFDNFKDTNGNHDYMDELVNKGEMSIPKGLFKDKRGLVWEIRQVVEDGNKRYIYLHIESSNREDQEMITEALSKTGTLTDRIYIYTN